MLFIAETCWQHCVGWTIIIKNRGGYSSARASPSFRKVPAVSVRNHRLHGQRDKDKSPGRDNDEWTWLFSGAHLNMQQ